MTELALTESLILEGLDCKTITSNSRSNFSSSFFFLPSYKRKAMECVYAFFRVIDDVVDEGSDPIKQKAQLNNWQAQLNLAVEKGSSPIPLLQELVETISRFNIPLNYFTELIEGCEMDLVIRRYLTFETLYQYCYKVASIVGLVCLRIFEYSSPTAEQMAIDLGIALQLTNIIRDVGVDLQKGRIYLPLEDLNKFGVSELDLQLERKTPAYLNLMEFEYARAITYYEKSSTEFPKDSSNKLLAARIMSRVYKTLLEKIRSENYPNLKKRVKLSYTEKTGILFSIFMRSFFKA